MSPTLRWIESGVAALAYSNVHSTPDSRDEVRLTLIDDAGAPLDSVRVTSDRTPQYRNTAIRALDVSLAANGPLLVGASRLSASPRTILIGCP